LFKIVVKTVPEYHREQIGTLLARLAEEPKRVLWFGQASCHPRPDGSRPESVERLGKALEEGLSPQESRRVSVCVLDVAKRV